MKEKLQKMQQKKEKFKQKEPTWNFFDKQTEWTNAGEFVDKQLCDEWMT